MFSELREAGGPIDTIGNDAAQLVVNVDDAFQLVGGLGEDPTARTCSLRKETSRGRGEGVVSPSAAMLFSLLKTGHAVRNRRRRDPRGVAPTTARACFPN